MKLHFVILLMFVSSLLWAQSSFPNEVFHEGEVTMNDGKVYKGLIKYDLNSDVILFKNREAQGIATFGANQFKKFTIYQINVEKYRTFYTLPFRGDNGYRRPKIFEALYEGETSLVGREYIIERSTPISRGFNRRSLFDPFFRPQDNFMTTRYLAYKLFIVDQSGGIELLGKTRRDVIRAFDGHHGDLRRFMKKSKTRVNRTEDLVEIVQYYNRLNS